MSRIKQLTKDSVTYGIGGVLAKSVSFFLLPVYTRIFSPTDYGTIEMLAVMGSFMSAILVMGMDSAQTMFFFKYKEEGIDTQARIVSSILQWRLIWGAVIVLLATFLAPLLNAAFFNGKLGWEYFAIAFVGTLFAQIMSQSAEVMRLLYRPLGYIAITLSQSLVAAALVLLFVLVLDQGILGFFLGAALASALIALFGWYRIREYLTFDRIHWDWWPQLIRFGAPLVPAGLAFYFMSTVDRWFVQYYHGPEALGIFAVGAKFAMLMALAVEAFRKAWLPIAMDAIHSDDGPKTFRLIALLYMGVGTATVVMLTLISPWLVQWFTAPAFHDAWPIVAILAWQALFNGFFLLAAGGIWKAEKTYLNLYLMTGAAALGITLNWLLVPPFGGMGAALATALTYTFWVFASMAVSEKLWLVCFPIMTFVFQISIGALFVGWFVFINRDAGAYLSWSLGVLLSVLLLLSALPAGSWQALRKGFNAS